MYNYIYLTKLLLTPGLPAQKDTVERMRICKGCSLLTEQNIICKLLLGFLRGFRAVPALGQGMPGLAVGLGVRGHAAPSPPACEPTLGGENGVSHGELGSPRSGLFVWVFVGFQHSEAQSHGEGSP